MITFTADECYYLNPTALHNATHTLKLDSSAGTTISKKSPPLLLLSFPTSSVCERRATSSIEGSEKVRPNHGVNLTDMYKDAGIMALESLST